MKKKINLLKSMIKLGIVVCFIFVFFHVAMFGYCLVTPKVEINEAQSYYLYDSKEQLIFDDNDSWIHLRDISPYLIEATINTEDKYFYKHLGFDYLRIGKAIMKNIASRSLAEGASTITQQYARNLFLNYDKTWSRKFDEAVLAFELEVHYSKDEILEGYLNTINYGGVFGIDNASWFYFGHSASDLTLAEASMLAGIPQSPSNFSPLVNEELAKNRQKIVLRSMVNCGSITEEEMKLAYNTSLNYIGKSNKIELKSLLYYRDAVLSELKTIASIPNSLIETGGLKIYTALDMVAQTELENATNDNVDADSEIQMAGVMMDPNNGRVLALIGGINYSTSQYNRAISAKRQVGSTMKPLLYYAALESGFTSASSFISEKTTFTFSNGNSYTPSNYNDTYGNEAISMGAAIAYSDNIYAVKTHLFLGEDNLVNFAHKLGISSEMSAVPSLALGTEEISLIEMVQAYSTFANMGSLISPHFILKVEDKNGNILYECQEYKEEVLNPSLTYILNEMLTYTYDTSFIDYNYPTVISLVSKMTNRYSIKTGTTNTDMLIVGYNKNAVLGIWSGYDDNRQLTSADSGFHKNIWVETMEGYLKEKDNSFYVKPDDVVGVVVNPITGNLIQSGDEKGKIFYFLKGTEPTIDVQQDLETVWDEEYGDNSYSAESEDSNNQIEESNDFDNIEEDTINDVNDNLNGGDMAENDDSVSNEEWDIDIPVDNLEIEIQDNST